MALAVAVSPIGTYSPRTVQITVSGMTVGQAYEVTGSWSGGSWPVRAGTGTAEGAQLVLPDLATPINTPITYTVTHAGATVTSAAITVDYAREGVLQSLSGDVSVAAEALDNGAPWEPVVRQSAFMIPGRARPALRYDIAGGESGQLEMETDGADTQVMKSLLKAGAPLLLRTDGLVGDLDAVLFLSIRAAPGTLLVGTLRRWRLDYQVIDDPEPDALIGLPTWDDFDAAWTVVPTVLRTNLVRNPSLEVDAVDWAGQTNAAVVRSTAKASVGAASLEVKAAAAGDMAASNQAASRYAVVEGSSYAAQVRTLAAATARVTRLVLTWTDGAGVVVGTAATGADVTNSTTAWTKASVVGTAPVGATQAWLSVVVVGAALDEIHYVDAAMVAQSTTVDSYLDGDTPRGTYKYAWTGTAHASTSTESTRELTWDDFDAEFTGLTWNDFDTIDWATRAAS